ncbi:MAG: demethoxyubiquinone hydroxylase family protein [Alphaproteobacteria bacterium]|nr:demethoxyubiquinone hydroxylase family protein [Alphaproteobacteria bacterium]
MTSKQKAAEPRRLPGDPTLAQEVERALRVDHAGEYGAVRIYAGQLAVLGRRGRAAEAVRHMAAQEERHLAAFESLLADRGVRPTALAPVWNVAGFALGAATALLGDRAAMACTEAVEEVIDGHYRRQVKRLAGAEPKLAETLEHFRGEEIKHRDIARAEGAQEAPGYPVLTGTVRTATRLAIWLSERI